MRPCKSCRAPIHLLKVTGSDSWMPVDADPSPQGNLRINLNNETVQVLTDIDQTTARLSGTPLHQSHFATCPQASTHRRTR